MVITVNHILLKILEELVVGGGGAILESRKWKFLGGGGLACNSLCGGVWVMIFLKYTIYVKSKRH